MQFGHFRGFLWSWYSFWQSFSHFFAGGSFTRCLVTCQAKISVKKTYLKTEIYVPGYAQNAGFCTIYPRASGGVEPTPGHKVGKSALRA
jgi:hypothetical protein